MVGLIYLSNIYFTDASAAKARPILLLRRNSFNDILYMPLTSNTNTKGIKINNSNLAEGFLPKTSVIVFEKPGVIATSMLIKKIGTLKTDIYQEVIDEFVRFIQQ